VQADPRQHSPAAERNQGPILSELQRLLPARGVMIEIASGTGQHAAHFTAALAGWDWQPTDAEPGALASIGGWCGGLVNVRPPLQLDVLRAPWVGVPAVADAIFCANLLHISAWATCAALCTAPSATLHRTACCCSTAPTSSTASRRRRATSPSTPTCGRATPRGVPAGAGTRRAVFEAE
jgi:hypothetical protein